MNWLLITGDPFNPGDQFARLGVERLVRAVDAEAQIETVHKESHALREDRLLGGETDRAVVCGMPLFWSWGDWPCWDMYWWPSLLAWGANVPLLLAGVGSFAPWPAVEATDPARLKLAAIEMVETAQDAYARDRAVNELTGLNLPVMACPSVFAVDRDRPRGLKLCNLMDDGAHYRRYGPQEAEAWDKVKADVADILLAAGFTFVAHNNLEAWWARDHGWRGRDIVSDSLDPRYLLGAYAQAERYFGNRVHGSIVARSVGANVWSVGYDSRQEAVRLMGGRAELPSQLNLDELRVWAQRPMVAQPFDLETEWARQLAVFEEFATCT